MPIRAPRSCGTLARRRSRTWRAPRLELIDTKPVTLRIQTIDSFNYWLASQLPVASRTGGALAVTEARRRAVPARRAAHARGADSEAAFAADAGCCSSDSTTLAQRRAAASREMLSQRGALAASHRWRHEPAQRLGPRVDESLAAIVARAARRRCARSCPQALRARAQALPGVGALGGEPRDLAAWQQLAHLALTQERRAGAGASAAAAGRRLRGRGACAGVRELHRGAHRACRRRAAALRGARRAAAARARPRGPRRSPRSRACSRARRRSCRRSSRGAGESTTPT